MATTFNFKRICRPNGWPIDENMKKKVTPP